MMRKKTHDRPSGLAQPPVPEDRLRRLADAQVMDFGISAQTPCSVMVGQYPEQAEVLYDEHSPCEFGVVTAGCFRRYERHEETTLARGGIWFSGPWEPHGWQTCQPNAAAVVIVCAPSFLYGLPSAWPSPYLPFLRPSLREAMQPRTATERNEVVRFAERIAAEASDQGRGWRTLVQVELIRLLLMRMRAIPSVDKDGLDVDAQPERIVGVLDHVRKSLHERITLSDAARLAHMGRTRFAEMFKRVTGTTFGQYVTRSRLEGARQDILVGDDKLATIARRWGFANGSHLCRCLKRHFGVRPSEIRQTGRHGPGRVNL